MQVKLRAIIDIEHKFNYHDMTIEEICKFNEEKIVDILKLFISNAEITVKVEEVHSSIGT